MTTEEQKEIFRKNFRRVVDESGKDQKQIARDLRMPYTTVNSWFVGKSMPKTGKIQTLADYFGIGKSDLLDDKSVNEMLTSFKISTDEKNLIVAYRKASPDIQDAVCKILDVKKDAESSDSHKKGA